MDLLFYLYFPSSIVADNFNHREACFWIRAFWIKGGAEYHSSLASDSWYGHSPFYPEKSKFQTLRQEARNESHIVAEAKAYVEE